MNIACMGRDSGGSNCPCGDKPRGQLRNVPFLRCTNQMPLDGVALTVGHRVCDQGDQKPFNCLSLADET